MWESVNPTTKTLGIVLVVVACVGGCASSGRWEQEAGHFQDFRTFHATGEIDYGRISDSYSADLVMYIDGSQYMVMKELIQDFQKASPHVKSIYVATLPPGEILQHQILKQGRVDGEKTNQFPDLYGSVSIESLQALKAQGRMENYLIYAHNKLELMVAKGNPKNIQGPDDLARDDLLQSHPNPLTEGIFTFYGAQMLKELSIYQQVTGNAECKACWAVPGKTWFTQRHHRETPYRIENGQADVGIVWATEVIEAISQHRNIDGVPIAAPYNQADKVVYVIGILNNAQNHANAELYLSYLRTRRAQQIYGKYGFLGASEQELELRPL
jgi:ABC-type molybdate transport system substrate-binding protein